MGGNDVPSGTISSHAEPYPAVPCGCLAWACACISSPPSVPTTPIPTAMASKPPGPSGDAHSPSFLVKASSPYIATPPAIGIGIGWGRSLCYDSEDDEDISEMLLEEEGGNFPRARKRHNATVRWRHHHRVDNIFDTGETPTPAAFAQILRIWPRWFQGRTRDGDVVMYEELGKLRGSSLREARLNPGAWSRHLALICEYVVRCMDQSDEDLSDGYDHYLYDEISSLRRGGGSTKGMEGIEELKEKEDTQTKLKKNPRPGRNNWDDEYAQGPPRPRITIVLSLAGVTSAGFFADFAVRKAVRIWSHILQAHYPGLVHRIFLVNVPSFLSPTALAFLQPLRLFPRQWRRKIWLVLEDGADGVATPLEDSHRALLATAGLSPSTCVLRGIESVIDSSSLSAAVFPAFGRDFGERAHAEEWAPLLGFVNANSLPETGKEG